MLIPFNEREQRIVARARAEYYKTLGIIAELKGIDGPADLHQDCIGFIVPDPPGFAPPAPTPPEPVSADSPQR